MTVASNSTNEISKCSYIAYNIFTKGIYKCSMTFVFRKTEIPNKTRQIKQCEISRNVSLQNNTRYFLRFDPLWEAAFMSLDANV